MRERLEEISAAVMREAEAETAHILREADAQLDALLAEARREEEERAAARLSEERARIEGEAAREIARAQRAMRMELLAARNRVIDEVFERARGEIRAMPGGAYREALRRWLSEIDAPEGGEIIPGSRDARLMSEIVSEANAGREIGARFTISSGTAPFECGFALRTKRFEVKRSLAEWLEEQRRELTPLLERELFGEMADAGGRSGD